MAYNIVNAFLRYTMARDGYYRVLHATYVTLFFAV